MRRSSGLNERSYAMKKNTVADRITGIISEVERTGHQSATRLTIIKKWLQTGDRLASFAVFSAKQAIAKGKRKNVDEQALFSRAEELYASADVLHPKIAKQAGDALYDALRKHQSTYKQTQWGSVRLIQSMDLLLIEQAIDILLYHRDRTEMGYELLASQCVSYDPRHGNGLYPKCLPTLKDVVCYIREKEEGENRS